MIRGKYLDELPLWNYSSKNKKITLREIVDRKTINYCLKISNEILNSKDFIFLKKIFNKNLIQLHLAYFLYYDIYYSICDTTILKELKKKRKQKFYLLIIPI